MDTYNKLKKAQIYTKDDYYKLLTKIMRKKLFFNNDQLNEEMRKESEKWDKILKELQSDEFDKKE